MSTIRKTSLVFGLFFAGTFIFSIPALFFYDPVLHNASYILGVGFDGRISMGALFEILLAICNIATAIIIFPIVKQVNESISLGYIASRIVESVLILAGVISLMAILTLRANYIPGDDTVSLTWQPRGFWRSTTGRSYLGHSSVQDLVTEYCLDT